MPGTLFVVATPIGNLEDITLRALRILREVTIVAAEDTRRTTNLLRHYQISTPLISLHEHNERRRSGAIIERLLAGDSVALVSDAGTPGISDPGAALVHTARAAGIRVDPIPGPSAVTAALSASGLNLQRFAFAGFPPVRSKDRKLWFRWVQSLQETPVVCFEAPHRIRKTLSELRSVFVKRQIILVRELTKVHEEWILDDAEPVPRGEFVILIGQTIENGHGACIMPSSDSDSTERRSTSEVTPGPDHPGSEVADEVTDEQIAAVFGEMTENAAYGSRRSAVRAVADRLGLTSRIVYAALERAKT